MKGIIRLPGLTAVILSTVLLAALCIYLALLAPDKFGGHYDDSMYVTTAKALATRQGYRIISLPYEPAQTKYPPFYPFLLSLIWREYPRFPENLTLMMLLSVAATITFLAMTWKYLVKQGYAGSWQGLIIVALAAVNVRTLILATSILSEMVYAALSVIALYLAENYEKAQKSCVYGALLGGVIGMAFLTRSAGIALLIAVATFFTVRRQWKKGLLPVVIAGVFVVGWAGWCYVNRSLTEGVNAAYYTSYLRDFSEVINGLQAINHESKVVILIGILAKNVLGFILVSVPICLGLPYEFTPYFGFAFFFIAAGFVRQWSSGLRLLPLYVVSYLALNLMWPYVTYGRFLTPVLPFLLFFMIAEFTVLTSLLRKEWRQTGQALFRRASAAIIALAMMVSAFVALYYSGLNTYRSLASSSLKKTAGPSSEDAQAIEWIRANTDPSDVVICSRDPMYYLYTGRKATRSFPVNMSDAVSFQSYQPEASERSKAIFRIIAESNGRYIILTSSDFGYDFDPQRAGLKTLLEEHPEMFIPVFKATDGSSVIYRIT